MKKKIFKVLPIFILIIFICTNMVYANSLDLKKYDPREKLQDSPVFLERAGKVIGWISTIGILISVIVVAAIGVKYMLSSIDEKVEFKKSMLPYVVGCFMLMAASIVVKLIESVAEI